MNIVPGPSNNQFKMEDIPPPSTQIYAYTNADAIAGTSNVVAGQILVSSYFAQVLFDSGASHSFISKKLAHIISKPEDRTHQVTRTSLPSGEILESDYVLRNFPVEINGVCVNVNLIAIEIQDFDVILGMDFLS